MDQSIIEQITNAEARALATTGPHGVNVVPVSVVKVLAEHIYLYNFFMGKTAENLQVETDVALTCWKGLEGIQVKAAAEYLIDGDYFEAARVEMLERFPSRTLRGIVKLTPRAIYDTSADINRAGKEILYPGRG